MLYALSRDASSVEKFNLGITCALVARSRIEGCHTMAKRPVFNRKCRGLGGSSKKYFSQTQRTTRDQFMSTSGVTLIVLVYKVKCGQGYGRHVPTNTYIPMWTDSVDALSRQIFHAGSLSLPLSPLFECLTRSTNTTGNMSINHATGVVVITSMQRN
jgi:hypothetical protein